MSGLKVPAVQVGLSGTATQNFTLTTGADGTATLARGNVGATTQDVLTIDASGNILFPADSNLLGKSFVSAEQTITSGGGLTIPHGLGSTPSLIQARLICKTDEDGYVVGDELITNVASDWVTTSRGMGVWPDSTNINIRFGDAVEVFSAVVATTGAFVSFNQRKLETSSEGMEMSISLRSATNDGALQVNGVDAGSFNIKYEG